MSRQLTIIENPDGRIYCKTANYTSEDFFQWHPRKGKYDLFKAVFPTGPHVWAGDTNFFEHALNWLYKENTCT
jgi:hypothetical protein